MQIIKRKFYVEGKGKIFRSPYDEFGSYTGISFQNESEKPCQDVDDL